MKNNIITLLMFLSISSTSLGQKLHAFLIFNGEDREIGAGCIASYNKLTAKIAKISEITGLELDSNYYKNKNEISALELEGFLKNFTCDPDDVVLFFYGGHGFNHEKEGQPTQFAAFGLDNTKFSQDVIHNYLKGANPRLCITMYDACNWYSRQDDAFFTDRRATIDIPENYKKLFLYSKGDIKMISNKAGSMKYSFYDLEKGGYFLNSFLDAMSIVVTSETNECTWQNLFELTKSNTVTLANNRGRKQEPDGDMRVSVNSRPITRTPPISTPENPNQYAKSLK